jgi:3'-phosphoadenosine 5'-phosphosulfate sulfotransferase (PAPS reductase)/FAD synthetase
MKAQHFGSVSGGKDSQAVLCLMRERLDRRGLAGFGNLPPRFVAADTGNEHPIWHEHMAYLADWLWRETGLVIEIVRADFAAEFAERRETIRKDWAVEKRRTEHSADCKARREAIPKLAKGCRASRERSDALRRWVASCDCPVRVSPPVPPERIEAAIEALQPTGNPFLDLCMLKGRFPGAKTRFCTERLKLEPMWEIKAPLIDQGVPIVEWIGERAEESKARERKPVLERIRHERASQVLYRPIHGLKHREVFEISKRHGLKPNPLYLMGMGRVGCWPCIMEKKQGVRIIAERTPDQIDRLARWEALVRLVSRRGDATFFCAKMIPGEGDGRAHIRAVVEWSRTLRGGRQFDLIQAIEADEARALGINACSSVYGLCE